MYDASTAWLQSLDNVIQFGDKVAPRGQPTRELLHRTICVNMRYPVITVPERKLSYKFMAAEAYWILMGDDRVSTIEPYNKHITQFSDDGVRFAGAYGPRITAQLEYVVDTLEGDPSSRQAGLTIWKENPPPSKDIPCTVSIFFSLRQERLNCHVFMRSSDLWLGVPYDIFNFSMLGHAVCALLNRNRREPITPGALYLTAASQHLYERDGSDAIACARQLGRGDFSSRPTPSALYYNTALLLTRLEELRSTSPGDPLRWWEGTKHENL